MTLEIRNFERGDCGRVVTTKPHGLDRDGIYYEGMEKLGRTMVEDGQPIACWGMQPHWEGVATVWSEFSERALTKYPVALAKNVRRHLNEHIKSLSLHRVQSMIPAEDKVTCRWIEWLGFHYEGRFEQYMKGMDVLMYARIIS